MSERQFSLISAGVFRSAVRASAQNIYTYVVAHKIGERISSTATRSKKINIVLFYYYYSEIMDLPRDGFFERQHLVIACMATNIVL